MQGEIGESDSRLAVLVLRVAVDTGDTRHRHVDADTVRLEALAPIHDMADADGRQVLRSRTVSLHHVECSGWGACGGSRISNTTVSNVPDLREGMCVTPLCRVFCVGVLSLKTRITRDLPRQK